MISITCSKSLFFKYLHHLSLYKTL